MSLVYLSISQQNMKIGLSNKGKNQAPICIVFISEHYMSYWPYVQHVSTDLQLSTTEEQRFWQHTHVFGAKASALKGQKIWKAIFLGPAETFP